jgi:hypothetical protein
MGLTASAHQAREGLGSSSTLQGEWNVHKESGKIDEDMEKEGGRGW